MPMRSKKARAAIHSAKTVIKPAFVKNKINELERKGYVKIRTKIIHHKQFSEVKKLLEKISSRSWGKIGGGGLRFQTSLSGISNSTDKEHKEKIAE